MKSLIRLHSKPLQRLGHNVPSDFHEVWGNPFYCQVKMKSPKPTYVTSMKQSYNFSVMYCIKAGKFRGADLASSSLDKLPSL